MQKPSVSFFCPAYNDEGNIRRTVENVMATLDRVAEEYEITIVEDGSPDGTGAVADGLAGEYPQVSVIHNPRNMGYGGALRTGFNAARKYEVVTYTDGDGQYDFFEFQDLLAAWDGESLVCGYRLNRADSRSRMLQSWVFEICLRFLFGLKVKDVNCSMKLFPRSALDKIQLVSDSAFIDAEILIKLSRMGYRIVQVGVHHFPRLHGAASGAKPGVIFTTISDMFRQFWRRGRT